MSKLNDVKSKTKIVPYEEPGKSSGSKLLSKRDLIDLVRKNNPAELNVAPSAFWDVEDTLKTGVIDDSNLKQQLGIVENGVLYSAKLYNDIKVKNDMLAKSLKKKLANLDEQRRNFESLNSMKQAETGESKRIAELQQEANNVDIEIIKITHYSRQLDHMASRLKANQLKFDSHMGMMETTMPAIIKEEEDISHLKRSLMVGLGKASLVLEQTKQNLATARKDREGLMRKRLDEVKNAEMLQEWMERRKEAKLNLALELRGDLTKDEERFLSDQINSKVEETKRLQKENEDSTKLLFETENFFGKLKQITGVTSLENMAEKFSLQKISKIDLEKEVAEVERKLGHAKKELIFQEKLFTDLKSTGAGQADLSRSASDKLTQDIEKSRSDLKLTKASSERLATILLELQQSSNGLLQRLYPHSELAEMDNHTLSTNNLMELIQQNNTLSSNGQNSQQGRTLVSTLDALNQSEAILSKMLEVVTSGVESNNVASVVGSPMNQNFTTSFPFVNDDEDQTGGGVNIRVKSKKMKRADEFQPLPGATNASIQKNNSSSNNAGYSSKPDKYSSSITQSSSALLSSSLTNNMSKNNLSKSGTPNTADTTAGRSKLTSATMNSIRNKGGNENEIPSRELVKSRSERRLTEEIQRIRREKKKNKLLQQQSNRKHTIAAVKAKQQQEATATVDKGRTSTANGAASTKGAAAALIDDDDDGKLAADLEFKMMAMNLAAKEQQEYCQKLSGSMRLMADAGNNRSDVMTKVKAFFDKKPELD